MNVSLTPELERIVTAKVNSGLYGSSSEVVRAALRLLHLWEMDQAIRLELLRRDVGVGLEQADLGDMVDGATAIDALLKKRVAQRPPATAKTRRPRKAGR
jgi:antitoxin ParD1/3/4